MSVMDLLDDRVQLVAQRHRGYAADRAGDIGPRAVHEPQGVVADIDRLEAGLVVLIAQRIVGEVADCGQHCRDRVRIPGGGRAMTDVLDQQPAPALDQEGLLDAEAQRVPQHDLGKRHAAARRLEAPAQSLDRQAVLQGLIDLLNQALERLADRTPDCRTHDREQDIGEEARITLYRVLDTGRDRLLQGVRQFLGGVVIGAVQRPGQGVGDALCLQFLILRLALQAVDAGLLGTQQQGLEFGQRRAFVVRGRCRRALLGGHVSGDRRSSPAMASSSSASCARPMLRCSTPSSAAAWSAVACCCAWRASCWSLSSRVRR